MVKCNCPEIRDEEWEMREHHWYGKTFYSKRVFMLFHTPISIEDKIKEAMNDIRIRDYELTEPTMTLIKDALFIGNVMIEVKNPDRTDPNIFEFQDVKLISKVFNGPREKLRNGINELIKEIGTKPSAVYFWYVTCPICFEERGYKTLIFAQLP